MKKEAREDDHEVEVLKAVAQAWHGRSGSPRPMKELDTEHSHYNRVRSCSRFKLEAINIVSKELSSSKNSSRWDFSQSLWDSYEIVTLSKKLEAGLVLDHPMDGSGPATRKRRRESKNSLRNLFHRISSKRIDDLNIPRIDDDSKDNFQISS
ncbi:uncharacterized protein LOC131219411 [Magnolia sinica]|uniref:uncharacterized protein LOC131219411 n=1 Tax=Magnolia sinica TaxID=86752 RepID=UPI00265B3F0B|nr:uncharacterized protein LOC131219411 [Magnolia sinica]